jgi:hypothetical protein
MLWATRPRGCLSFNVEELTDNSRVIILEGENVEFAQLLVFRRIRRLVLLPVADLRLRLRSDC